MTMSRFISSGNCCSTETVCQDFSSARCYARSYVILVSFNSEKHLSQVATLTVIVRKICSIISKFETEFQRFYIWIYCKSSRRPSFSIVNCTSATSYNCDTTLTVFLTAQQWTTSDATTINISFSTINCAQPPIQQTDLLGIWMQYGDLKIFKMTHQQTEARNRFP